MKNILLTTAVALLALAFGISSALAQTSADWTGATSGNLSVSTNWTPNTSPSSTFTGNFNSANYTNTANATANAAFGKLHFGSGNTGGITFETGTGILTLSGASGIGVELVSGSGAVNTGGARFTLGGNQTWLNNSGNGFTANGAIITAGFFLTANGSGTTALGGVISGGGGIVKNGSGTLRLSNANSFTGPVTLNSGTLDLTTNNGQLGNSTTSVFTINGGALDTSSGTARTMSNAQVWNGDFSFLGTGGIQLNFNTGAVTLGGNRTITVGNSTLSETGVIGDGGNGYGLTKEGAGNLSLGGTASNTYTGNTTVNAGDLTLGASNKISDSGNLVVNGGRFLTAGFTDTVNNFVLAGGYATSTSATSGGLSANTFDLRSDNGTIASSINLQGSGNLTKSTSGTVTLSGNNSYSGTTTVDDGILILTRRLSLYSGANASWTKSNITVNSGGTLAFAVGGSNEFSSADMNTLMSNLTGDVSLGGFRAGSTISLGVNVGTAISSAISEASGIGGGAINLFKYGSSALTLSGNNTYTGNTTISAGTLTLGTGGRLGGGNYAGDIINNGVLNVAMGANSSQTFSGIISGNGTLTNGGVTTQTITLSGNNSYSGGSSLSTSAFVLGHKNALGTGLVTMVGGQAPAISAGVDLSGADAIGNNVAMNGGFSISGSNNMTLSGILTLDGNRALTVSNTAETALTGPIHLSNGVTSGNLTLTAGTGSGPITVSGLIDEGAAPQGLKFSFTTGALIKLTNPGNSYTGATEGLGTAVGNLEVSKLANGGSVSSIGASSNASSNLILSLDSRLRYVGSGDSTDRLFTMTGLRAGIDSSGSGALNFTNTGSIAYGAVDVARTLTLSGNNTATNTFAPTIGNNGAGVVALTKSGVGTWQLGGNNSYTGVTTINGGILNVSTLADGGSNSSIGAAAAANANLVINGGGTLRYVGSGNSTDRGFTLSSGNGTTIESSGSGAINFTGVASISGTANETLTLAGTNTGNNTLALNLGSSASLVKAGAGTWVLSGTKSYTGTTSINAGTLVVDATGSWSGTSGIAISGSTSKLRYDSTTALSRNVTVTSGGTFAYNSSGNYTGTLTLTNGKLGGTNWNGTKLGGLTIGADQTISPGNSVGTASTSNQTWANNGSYDWEINKADGIAGDVSGGWDLFNLTGALTLSATSVNPFTINIISLGLDNLSGPATGFSDGLSYNWLIADAGSAISGFDANIFTLDVSGFQNAFTGAFGIELGNTGSLVGIGDTSQIYLTYSAIPEPATWMLLVAGGSLVAASRRRRRE